VGFSLRVYGIALVVANMYVASKLLIPTQRTISWNEKIIVMDRWAIF
jgi:hypothetical protein